jgi:uncharacterized protein (DUF58 family)
MPICLWAAPCLGSHKRAVENVAHQPGGSLPSQEKTQHGLEIRQQSRPVCVVALRQPVGRVVSDIGTNSLGDGPPHRSRIVCPVPLGRRRQHDFEDVGLRLAARFRGLELRQLPPAIRALGYVLVDLAADIRLAAALCVSN